MEDYFLKDAISASLLKDIAIRSPKYAKWKKENYIEDTAAQRIGTAFHRSVLETEKFNQYKVFDGVRRGKAWDEFKAEHGEDYILNKNEFNLVLGMSDSIKSNNDAMKYIRNGTPEKPLLWKHQKYGCNCKSKIDYLSSVIVELKSAASIDNRRFIRSYIDYGYDIAAAFYHDAVVSVGIGNLQVKLIVVEKNPPFDCVVYNIHEAEIMYGRDKYHRAIETWMKCIEKNYYPGVAESEIDLFRPDWAIPQDDDVDFGDEIIGEI